jgi:glycerophosphoryl diester phosphodiesterase
MRQTIFTILLCCIVLVSCKKNYEVIMPDASQWTLFNDPAAVPLPVFSRPAMEGVYTLNKGADIFGDDAALKWSYSITGRDTLYHVSAFFGKDIAYLICEGKQLNGQILFNGYWRKMVSTETGLVQLTIARTAGGDALLTAGSTITPGSIVISGLFGNGQQPPDQEFSMTYTRKLNNTPAFNILAHRSGGRTSDLLPVSENSVAMILKTPEFGSTGVEVDVRFTKDGVPILYHDNTLNLRETQKSGLVGPIENYTYNQLSVFVRLVHGESIPTLREALDAVLYRTPLTFVWLDTKYIGSLAPVQAIQAEYLQKAAAAGRKLEIVIGLPGEDQYNQFLALPGYATTPSLCELTPEQVEKVNAKIWAPRFTEGTQDELVNKMHAAGRRAFIWTVDVPEFINRYIVEGHFDGMLSNFPSCVAYNYYVHQ